MTEKTCCFETGLLKLKLVSLRMFISYNFINTSSYNSQLSKALLQICHDSTTFPESSCWHTSQTNHWTSETLSSTWTPEFTEPNETVCDLKQNHFGSCGFTENPQGKPTPQKWAKAPPQLLLWPCLILFFKLFGACGEYEMDASGKLPLGQRIYVFIEHAHHKFSWLHTGSDQAGAKCRTGTSLIFHFFSLGPPFWQTLVLLRIDEPSQTNQRRHLATAPCKWTNRINLSAGCA